MDNIYIIGDVHGCYKTLLALINKLPNKQSSKIVFYLFYPLSSNHDFPKHK